MLYDIALERADVNCPELMPLYCAHYREMQERLQVDGIEIPPFRPNLPAYFAGAREGRLLNYVARSDGKPVGYSNIWLTSDMHNGDFIAKEDTIYVTPDHRNGLGRRLVKHILADLRARGVKRVWISPVTDLRVGKIWERMGFKRASELMVYNF